MINSIIIAGAAGAIGIADQYLFSKVFLPATKCSHIVVNHGNYFCLPVSQLIDSSKVLSVISKPLGYGKSFIASTIQLVLPNYKLFANATACTKLSSRFGMELPKSAAMYFAGGYDKCCLGGSPAFVIASAFTEEFLFRYLIQKVGLLFVTRFLPKNIGKPLSSRVSRILITAAIFTAFHPSKMLFPTIFSSLLFGGVSEYYGFLASTVTHVAHNYFQDVTSCEELYQLIYKYF